MDELKEICDIFLAKIKEKCDPTIYRLWLKDLELYELDSHHCLFGIANAFKRDILEKHYGGLVAATMEEIVGFPVTVEFTTSDESKPPVTESEEESKPAASLVEDEKRRILDIKITTPTIDENYSFENFIVGESNKFAYAAARAVADDPSVTSNFNPLFIHGPSGLGKTHLLIAITNEIKRHNPDVHIIYKHGEDFTNEMIAALQKKAMDQFRYHYRKADVLLIDDIQFIAGKVSIQEEFFHTFSSLYESKKQIILTSDRPPKEITPLEDRLRTRFEWGLIADIQPPSDELRTAIIRKKAESVGLSLPEDCISYLSNYLKRNVRQIEGTIKKISTLNLLFDREINLETCREALKDFIGDAEELHTPTITADRIIHVIAKHYSVSVEELKSDSRVAQVSNARHLCIYLIRKNTSLTYSQIGEIFGRNYATAISSMNKINNERMMDSTLDTLIQEFNKKITEGTD